MFIPVNEVLVTTVILSKLCNILENANTDLIHQVSLKLSVKFKVILRLVSLLSREASSGQLAQNLSTPLWLTLVRGHLLASHLKFKALKDKHESFYYTFFLQQFW